MPLLHVLTKHPIPHEVKVSTADFSITEKIRVFGAIENKIEQVDLVSGNNTIAWLENEATLPSDCGIQANRWSITAEKTQKFSKILRKTKSIDNTRWHQQYIHNLQSFWGDNNDFEQLVVKCTN